MICRRFEMRENESLCAMSAQKNAGIPEGGASVCKDYWLPKASLLRREKC